jgi:hypothetical protein
MNLISRGSSVSIVTRLWVGRPGGVQFSAGKGIEGAISSGIRQPGRESDHSPPSSADVKNVWSYISTPPYVFTAWRLVKHRIRFHGVVLG